MHGALLALLSAAIFGLTSAALRRGVLKGSVLQGLVVTVPLGVPMFAVAIGALGAIGALAGLSHSAWIWMTVAGVVHFVFGRYGNFRATRALGSAQSAPMQQITALVSLALALIFLEEYLTPLSALGVALVIAGPAIVLWRRFASGAVKTDSGIQLNYVEGYFWGAVCAVSWGVSPRRFACGATNLRPGNATRTRRRRPVQRTFSRDCATFRPPLGCCHDQRPWERMP